MRPRPESKLKDRFPGLLQTIKTCKGALRRFFGLVPESTNPFDLPYPLNKPGDVRGDLDMLSTRELAIASSVCRMWRVPALELLQSRCERWIDPVYQLVGLLEQDFRLIENHDVDEVGPQKPPAVLLLLMVGCPGAPIR